MDININQYFPHIFLLLFAFALFEYFLCHAFWFKNYFRYGVVCFFIKFKVNSNQFVFSDTSLEKTFTGVSNLFFPISAMIFKTFSNYECAFREKFEFRSIYLAIMHGMMTYDPETEKVTIKGKLNYFPVIMFVIIIPVVLVSIDDNPSFKDGIILGPLLFVFFFTAQLIRYLIISFRCKALFNNTKNTGHTARPSLPADDSTSRD